MWGERTGILALVLMGLLAGRGLGQESSAPKRFNILVAISDDQSYPYALAYGSRMVQTPAFDRVAQGGRRAVRTAVPGACAT